MERSARPASVALAVLWLVTACASFQPSHSPTPSTGRLVRARFDPPAELVLTSGAMAMPVRELMGTMAATAGDTLWLAPRRAYVGAGSGEQATADRPYRTVTSGFDERVAISHRQPGLELREWRFSPGRTLALAAVLAFVGAFVATKLADGIDAPVGLDLD